MKIRRLFIGIVSFVGLCNFGWLFVIFASIGVGEKVSFYRHPAGYEVAEIWSSSGFVDPNQHYQMLVRADARSRWKALWTSFHGNSNPRLFWSKQGSLLFINECVPSGENNFCGPSFFSMAYDFRIGKTLVASKKPNRQTDSTIRTLIAKRAALFEAEPHSKRDLGRWFWQDFRLKRAYERFWH